MKLVALAFASLIGFAGAGHADAAPTQTPYDASPGAVYRHQGQGAPLRAAIVARFDRDGDGRLSPQERRHAARALRKMARKMARGERRAARRGGGAGPGQPRVDVDVNW
jgi:hypothetical protein